MLSSKFDSYGNRPVTGLNRQADCTIVVTLFGNLLSGRRSENTKNESSGGNPTDPIHTLFFFKKPEFQTEPQRDRDTYIN